MNFDASENWYFYKDVNVSSLTVDPIQGAMTVTAVGQMADSGYPCIYFDTIMVGNYHTYPLNYDPQKAEVYQLRFKLEGFTTGSQVNDSGNTVSVAPYVILQYFVDGTNTTATATESVKIPVEALNSGKFVTLTATINDTFRSYKDIDKIRVFFGGIESLNANTPGKITLDYVYVGPEAGQPTANFTVTFKNWDGTVLETKTVAEGGTVTYTGKTPAKDPDASNHYTFKDWDKALTNITADTVVTAQYTATAHTVVTDKGYAPTCQKPGLSDGSHCSVCGKVLKAQTVMPVVDHNPVTVPGTPATCLSSGLSDGSKCEYCGITLAEQTVLPRLGHNWSYKDLGESHTATCTRCSKTQTATHSYENGSCICGATESAEPTVDSTVVINHTLNLASDISINFAVRTSLLTEYVNHYLEVEIPVYEGTAFTGTRTETVAPVLRGSYYYYTLEGLTAVQIGDRVQATLYMEKNGKLYCSTPDSYAISDYAYAQMKNGSSPATLKTLCADLLRYGAMAQIYKNYRTDSLCDSAMTEAQKAYLSDLNAVTFGNHNSVATDMDFPAVTWVGKALNLDSKVTLRLVCNTAGYLGNPEDLVLEVCYRDYAGQTQRKLVTNPIPYGTGNQYAFDFDGLLAAELRSVLTLTVYDGQSQLSNPLYYSPDTYGRNKTGNLVNLCKALFAYSDSAKAYFVP